MAKERDFQTKFTNWLKNVYIGNGVFELKLSKEKSIPFNAVQGHQKDALLAAKKYAISYKIPDDARGFKPFDCFHLSKIEAYVVIQFYTPGEKLFYMIDIEDWIAEEHSSVRKSLTEERANEIGKRCVLGKSGPITSGIL